MSLTAAASGLVVFLLSVQVIQAQDDWGVTYHETEICALKGSTVYIHCSYTYPSRINNRNIQVEKAFWFTKQKDGEPVALKTDWMYSGRVYYYYKPCYLKITDLKESDSAVYKFRFITNHQSGKYTGEPGVTLDVTDPRLKVQVKRSSYSTRLSCHSSCVLPHRPAYIWYRNGHEVRGETSSDYSVYSEFTNSYSCAIRGSENHRSPSVYAPKLPSVSVSPSGEIVEGSSVNLTCSSDANPAAKYTWYKKNGNPDLGPLSEGPQLVFSSIQSSDSGEYECTAENLLGRKTTQYISIDVKYAPKLPSVSVSPSGEIEEGSSVTLTCSSDANPAAKYTWYKENQPLLHGPEGVYHFTSIRSEDRGIYYCKSENQHGWMNSTSLFIDVQYAPKRPSVSVSPSGEIVEGSSVNLTCSSDANPAAKYTWYKKNQPLRHGPEGVYHFTSISSEDRGIYYCKSENKYDQINSTSVRIDVQYAPKPLSVSVSPSGEIVEGSSVNLTCSSDANPAAKYTWYKENEESPKESGQMLTIPDIRAEHSGNYYCEAQNRRGRRNSTLHLTVVAGPMKIAAVGSITAICLSIIFLSAFLLIRRKRSSNQIREPGGRPDNKAQVNMASVCNSPPAEQEDDLCYASVIFSKNQEDPLYSNIRPAQPRRHNEEEEEEDDVEYTAVIINSDGATTQSRQEAVEDPSTLYSTVNKK